LSAVGWKLTHWAYVGGQGINMLTYADDSVLLAPTFVECFIFQTCMSCNVQKKS